MTSRSIDSRFWSDGWIRKLNALDRYLFLYLLTNNHSTWCGVYELDLAMMAFESGIDKEDLMCSFLPRLSPKAIYFDGWVYVPNWMKYHLSSSGTVSPQHQKGFDAAWNQVPQRIRDKIEEIESKGYPMVGVSPSSSSSSSSLIGANAPRIEFIEETEERPKKETRSKDKEAIYTLFSSKEQPWWRHKQQKIAALALFDLIGAEKVRRGLEVMYENESDKYCPQAATPFEYEEQLPKLTRYIKRKGL